MKATTTAHPEGRPVSAATYGAYGCRCPGCTQAKVDYVYEWRRRNSTRAKETNRRTWRRKQLAWRWIRKNRPDIARQIRLEAMWSESGTDAPTERHDPEPVDPTPAVPELPHGHVPFDPIDTHLSRTRPPVHEHHSDGRLTAQQIAVILHVHAGTVQRWRTEGVNTLAAYRIADELGRYPTEFWPGINDDVTIDEAS